MYIGHAARFTLRYSYSHHASIGHTVKSRAQENYILYNRIMDEADGTSQLHHRSAQWRPSYIIGNLMQQGPGTDNPTILAYGAEGLTNPNRNAVCREQYVRERLGSGTFVSSRQARRRRLQNNLFVGNGTLVGGDGNASVEPENQHAELRQSDAFDYRPTAGTPGINGGTAPGSRRHVRSHAALPVRAPHQPGDTSSQRRHRYRRPRVHSLG